MQSQFSAFYYKNLNKDLQRSLINFLKFYNLQKNNFEKYFPGTRSAPPNSLNVICCFDIKDTL